MTDIGAIFRDLHQPGNPFVLMNVWDAGSAKVAAGLGAQALGTTSDGQAFTLGKLDMGEITRDEALAHAEMIVSAISLIRSLTGSSRRKVNAPKTPWPLG